MPGFVKSQKRTKKTRMKKRTTTKTMEKKEAGMAGPKLSEVVHEGDMVAVKYHDMGATKHAATITVRNAGAPSEKKKKK